MKTTTSIPPVVAVPAVAPNAVILSLDSPADAARSAHCPGPIYWTSTRPPAQALGALEEDFEGAWLEPAKLVVKAAGRQSEHPLPPSLMPDAAALLGPALAAHLRGESLQWSVLPMAAISAA